MSETPSAVAKVEAPPRIELPRPDRATGINSFNRTYDKYAVEMSPLLARLDAGEDLSREERKKANGFRVTRDGLNNVTGVKHEPGSPAIPDDLGSDEWNNVYRDASGNVLGKQREGIVTNHMLDWLDGEIKKQGEGVSAADRFTRDMLRASSGTYAELHTASGSMDRELRIRQEAGAIIHTDSKRDSVIPQDNETDRQAHERDDWQMASDEVDNRMELVLPPLKGTVLEVKVLNPSTVSLDSTLEPTRIHIPDSDGPPPFRVPGESNPVVIQGSGGEVVVPPVEVTSDYNPPVERTIPERLAPPASTDTRSERPRPKRRGSNDPGNKYDIVFPGEDPSPDGRREGGIPEKLNPSESAGDLGALAKLGAEMPKRNGKIFDPSSNQERPRGQDDDSSIKKGAVAEAAGNPDHKTPPDSPDPGAIRDVREQLVGAPGERSVDSEPVATGAETGDNAESVESRAERERGERLAKTSLGRRLWDRARDFITKIPSVNLPKIPALNTPRIPGPPRPGTKAGIAAAAVGLAALMMVVIDNCSGKAGQPGPSALPEQSDKRREVVVDRPQMPSVLPAEERAISIDPRQNTVVEPEVKVPAQEVQASGIKYASMSEDFSTAEGKQSIRGLTKDQLAQALDSQYEEEVRAIKEGGGNIDELEGRAEQILAAFQAGVEASYEGSSLDAGKIYKDFIEELVVRQKAVIEEDNRRVGKDVGIGEDGDTIVFGNLKNRSIQVLDVPQEMDRSFESVRLGNTRYDSLSRFDSPRTIYERGRGLNGR